MIGKLSEFYTQRVHGACIKAAADEHNKLTKQHMSVVASLHDTISDLQSDVTRLNKEILFTQEGYEREIQDLQRQLEYGRKK